MEPTIPGSRAALRVLVVDPDDRTCESLAGILGIGGRCTVVGGARDPGHALELAADLHPDVVVIDPHLPDLDGALAFVADLRRAEPSVRVLVMSRDDGRNGSGAAGLAAIADGYVRKTFRATELIEAVVAAGGADRAWTGRE